MATLFIETTWTFGALVILGLSGAFALTALQESRPFALLMAPMCGLLVLPPLSTLFYSTGKLSLSQSAILAMVAMLAATLFTATRIRRDWQQILICLPIILVVCAISALISTATNIAAATPSILFIDGTDHANYAIVADWLLNHNALQLPLESPTRPYESWPDVGLRLDPRLSSYMTLALVALLRGTSGLFAYDPACSIVLATAIIGVTGVFARSRPALIFLLVVLFLSVWFEYGRSGFFGKLTAYPSALFLIGVLVTQREWDAKVTSALGLLVVGAATMHPAFSTALFFVVIGGIYISARLIFGKTKLRGLDESAFGFAVCIMVAFASTGMFGRIFAMPIGQSFDETWGSILPRLFEIQNPTLDYIPLTSVWLKKGTFIALVLQILLTALAIFRRDASAIALIGGPPLVAVSFLMLGQNWIVYQMAGCIVPFSVCALGGWMGEIQIGMYKPYLAAILMLTFGFIVVRIPRTFIPIDRYVLHPPVANQFKASDIKVIAAAVGPHTVVVDIGDDRPALAVLVEFGRRAIDVQWSAGAWKVIVGYRQWRPPVYIANPEFWLGLARNSPAEGQIIFENDQFRLVKLK